LIVAVVAFLTVSRTDSETSRRPSYR
jgi:hypothetical protein